MSILPTSTYPAQFIFCGTAFRGKRAPKALKKFFGIDMVPFDAKAPWRIPVDELPPLLSETPSRRWMQYKEFNSEAQSTTNDVTILPSTRFLTTGEETNNAPWVIWGADIIAVCIFLEDRVTTEKRLQQVRDLCDFDFELLLFWRQAVLPPPKSNVKLNAHSCSFRVYRHSRNSLSIPTLSLSASDCNQSSLLTWV